MRDVIFWNPFYWKLGNTPIAKGGSCIRCMIDHQRREYVQRYVQCSNVHVRVPVPVSVFVFWVLWGPGIRDITYA